jgi:Methylamine utilisation protein MauE
MFAMSVDGYQILPPWGVSAVAHLLPFIELGLGLWLIAGVGLRFSSLISALVMLTFFGSELSVYLRNIQAPCGCGLIPGEQIGPVSLSDQ